jgi:hypothetical protein
MIHLNELRLGNNILAYKNAEFKTISIEPSELVMIQRAEQENVMDENFPSLQCLLNSPVCG